MSERNLLSLISPTLPKEQTILQENLNNRKAALRRASSGVNYFTGQMKF